MKSKKIPPSEVIITPEGELEIVSKYHEKRDLEKRKKAIATDIALCLQRLNGLDGNEVINMAIEMVDSSIKNEIGLVSGLKTIYSCKENELKERLIKKI